MPKPKKTIATPTSGPRQETKQIRLLLQPTAETGQVVCVSVVGSFDDENHKGFDNPLHDIWIKQPAKLATLFPDAEFIRPYHEKCPRHTSQENNMPLLCSVVPKWGPQLDKDNMFYTYVFLVDEERVDEAYKVIYETLMKVLKDYYANKPSRTYKGVTYVNEYPPFDRATNVKCDRIPLDRYITDNYTGRIAHAWFGATNEEEGNEDKSEQELEMMLYENLNADAQYPNFADSIFSRKQFVGKYCYAATNTYGYPTEGIAVKQEDTLMEEEEKIVAGNAMLISITDHTIGYEARLNLCRAEAIAAKKAGKSVEKYQLKKEADLKRKVTLSEVEHDKSAENLREAVGDGEEPPRKKRKKST
jgi:hypothetical protein